MIELAVTALRCDVTRVMSLMLGNGGSSRSFTFVDPSVTGGHHDLSHHQGDQENFRKLEIIDKWEVRQVAELARRLHAITDEGGESLLDNTIIFLSSEISDGDRHNHDQLPVLLLGRGGGTVTPGHIARQEQPLANLFISMLDAVGVRVSTFGDDGSGPLSLG
jgi:hypothetical protein